MPKATKPRNVRIGDNSLSAEDLRNIIERVDRLEEEKASITESIRDVYAEAKGNGFDVATIKRLRKLLNMDTNDKAEMNSLLDLYGRALEIDPFS